MFSHSLLTNLYIFKQLRLSWQIHMNFQISLRDQEKEAILYATHLLSQGLVIAVPTDTVYGLAADAQNEDAIKKIYKIKGRDLKKPIAICVGQVNDIGVWGKIKHLPENLLNELLPGPVTVVLDRTSNLNVHLNPGINKVGIRIPKNGFVYELSKQINSPLALTSANTSNKPSTLEPKEFQELWNKLGAVFDGGKLEDSPHSRNGSTVVDLTVFGYYSIIRTGSAFKNTIRILEKFELKNNMNKILSFVSKK